MNFLFNLFGDPNKKYLERLQPIINKINNLESQFQGFSNEELREKTNEFKNRLKNNETLDDIMPELESIYNLAKEKPTVKYYEHSPENLKLIIIHYS